MEKTLITIINNKVRDYLSNDVETIKKTIAFLINEKEKLNECIEDIIYCDIDNKLSAKDLKDIEEYRKAIAYCYNTIYKLEERRIKYESK